MLPKGIWVKGGVLLDIELLNLGTCPSPVAIAIGGGGRGYDGGGGSGYVKLNTNLPQKAYLKMALHPGEMGEDSYIRDRDRKDDQEIVRGGKGHNGGSGQNRDGGAGDIINPNCINISMLNQ